MIVYHEPSTLRLLAMYLSPMALPHEKPQEASSASERKKLYKKHMLQMRPFLRTYIFRSAHLVLGCFITAVLCSLFLPIILLSILAFMGFIIATLHTAFLIFLQQNANDIAASLGKKNPEIEELDEK